MKIEVAHIMRNAPQKEKNPVIPLDYEVLCETWAKATMIMKKLKTIGRIIE